MTQNSCYNGGKYYNNIWYNPDWNEIHNENSKTIFDPCPPNWQLPTHEIWEGFVKNARGSWDDGYKVCLAPLSSETAWLPKSGGDGNAKYGGALWANKPRSLYYGYALLYSTTSLYISNDFSHSYYNNASFRYAVRCVQSNQ